MRIQILSVALCIVASNAAAVSLDLTSANGIAALYAVSGSDPESIGRIFVVCTSGSGYMMPNHASGGWASFDPSPVPLAEVADWTPWMLYTTDGRWFVRYSTLGPWNQMGVDSELPPPPPCFTPIGAAGKTMGDVKSLFR